MHVFFFFRESRFFFLRGTSVCLFFINVTQHWKALSSFEALKTPFSSSLERLETDLKENADFPLQTSCWQASVDFSTA